MKKFRNLGMATYFTLGGYAGYCGATELYITGGMIMLAGLGVVIMTAEFERQMKEGK